MLDNKNGNAQKKIRWCGNGALDGLADTKPCFGVCPLKGGGGGGGGFTLFFLFVKLDFEIAVDQQTKAHNRTFEVVPDSGYPPVPAGQPRPYLVNFWLNFAKSP